MPLSHDEHVRLRTWAVAIAEALLPPGTQRQDRGGDWRFSSTGGLSIAKRSGAWYSHAAGIGSYNAVSLIELLRGCDRAEAEQWATAWLASHAGTGSCDGADDAADSQAAAQANAARAQATIDAAVPAEGTVAETYLRSRGIEPPYPDCVRFLPDARIGESALVGLLTAHDVCIGGQLTYLDPAGRKSLREPVRQTFVLDRERAKGAVFVVEKLSSNARMLLAEGLEDGLSLRACGRPEAIFALPGIGGLQHFPARRGQAITVVRDGDEPGSAADKALFAGLDHLLLQHADVWVTATPLATDANSILLAEGADALNALVDAADAAELSEDGEVTRLASLKDPADYDRERVRIADKFGIRRGTLDEKVRKAKPRPEKDKEAAGIRLPEFPLWDGPPVVLADVLDDMLAELRRFVVAPDAVLTTVVLWSAMTHLVHRREAGLGTVPRLHFCGPPGAGKTTCLDCIMTLSARALPAASISASAILRSMGVIEPTLAIDEIDNVLSDKTSDLLAILNASNRRRTAFVLRSVPTENGKDWESKLFPVWGAIASAGLEPLPPTQQSRAIAWIMQVASADAIPEQLEDGTAPKLIELHRRLAAWAAGLDGLPKPALPAALAKQPGRVADLWRPLAAIAELAGGDWPRRAADAIANNLQTERLLSVRERFLLSLRRAFDWQRHRDRNTPAAQLDARLDNPVRIRTETLTRLLFNDEEEEWRTANNGRPITAYYFRRALHGLLDPPGAQDWWSGQKDRRSHHSGYFRSQLERAWANILRIPKDQSLVPVDPSTLYASPHPSSVSGASGDKVHPTEKIEFSSEAIERDAPDPSGSPQAQAQGAPDPSGSPVPIPSEENPTFSISCTRSPVAPDAEGNGGDKDVDIEPKGLGGSAGSATKGQPRGVNVRSAGQVDQMIRDFAAAHPTWSTSQLAEASRQPISRVGKVLSTAPAPSGNGNGADAAAQPASIAAMIHLLAAIHPDWSRERLAKAAGQPVSIINRTLARKPRSSPGPAGGH